MESPTLMFQTLPATEEARTRPKAAAEKNMAARVVEKTGKEE